MKRLLEDRWLKVLSVGIAIVIWLYIFLILDPAQEVTVRDLPIEFIGAEQLNARGLSVVSESDTEISVKVSGSRKRMARNNMKSIIAKADISYINQEGVTAIPVDVVVPFENFGITSQDPYTVDVKVEPTVQKTIDIEIQTEGSLATDYMAGPMRIEDKTVTVTGPKSVVGKIGRAVVLLNYQGADVDIDETLPIRFYDTEDKEIVSIDAILSRIRTNISQTVLHCKVVKLKQVPISPVFPEEMQEGDYKLNIQKVQIYGDEQITSKVEEIKTEWISMEKLTSNQKTKVKLVIPEGVKVLQDISEVEVTLSKKDNGK
ncbi:MAG: hypothetical protein IJB80_00850 [Clostridia bacterium]|nr:hypothetical protein [Clostridia bacterium]